MPADNVYTKLETHKLSHWPNLVSMTFGLRTEVTTVVRWVCTVGSLVDVILTD